MLAGSWHLFGACQPRAAQPHARRAPFSPHLRLPVLKPKSLAVSQRSYSLRVRITHRRTGCRIRGRTDIRLRAGLGSSESCLQPRSALSETDNNPLPSYAARLLIRALTLSHSHPDMASTELFLLRCFLPFFFSFPRVSCETKTIRQRDLEEAQRFVSPCLGRDLYLCCWKKKGSEIMAIFHVFSGRGTNSPCHEEAQPAPFALAASFSSPVPGGAELSAAITTCIALVPCGPIQELPGTGTRCEWPLLHPRQLHFLYEVFL